MHFVIMSTARGTTRHLALKTATATECVWRGIVSARLAGAWRMRPTLIRAKYVSATRNVGLVGIAWMAIVSARWDGLVLHARIRNAPTIAVGMGLVHFGLGRTLLASVNAIKAGSVVIATHRPYLFDNVLMTAVGMGSVWMGIASVPRVSSALIADLRSAHARTGLVPGASYRGVRTIVVVTVSV